MAAQTTMKLNPLHDANEANLTIVFKFDEQLFVIVALRGPIEHTVPRIYSASRLLTQLFLATHTLNIINHPPPVGDYARECNRINYTASCPVDRIN